MSQEGLLLGLGFSMALFRSIVFVMALFNLASTAKLSKEDNK